ncbi:MAG: DUF1501 domain-containing protein [Planctomycetes bacterium]|nr:DUF1501 domain-containing protein [Planctomycetota bacterium]
MADRNPIFCPGPMGRRNFLRIGFLGMAGLGLGEWSRLHARAAEVGKPASDTACIFVYLHGGPSHLETYDLKPDAPEEYRGPFKQIRTKVPGMEICEFLPRHAQAADMFTLMRSCSHDSVCHDDGAQQMLSGRRTPFTRQPGSTIPNKFPDAGAIFKRLHPYAPHGLPSYVAVPHRQEFAGPGYLGMNYEPFEVRANPNQPTFQVPNISLPAESIAQLQDRTTLLKGFDRLRRDIDLSGNMEAMDSFHQEAVGLLTGDAARRAFDLSRVDPRERDRYGRSQFGQSMFLARRLVETGVGFVHVEGRAFADVAAGPGVNGENWDDHAVNAHIFDCLQRRLPWFDQGVAALVEDLYARGLDRRVLLIVTGEFGRTPRINSQVGTASKVMQPGRDHWPSAMSILLSGGGMRMGQVIGSTTARGETPKDRPLRPSDVMATVYHFLGIDPKQEFLDHSGRPLAILPDGELIRELVG